MEEVAKKHNIFFQWFSWHFLDMPKGVLAAWKNFLLFNLNYFSIPLLLKTFFAPWRRYKVPKGKGFDFGRYFEALFSNLIFRFLGASIRSIFIIFGLFVEAIVVVLGVFAFFVWIFLPLIFIFGIFWGIKIIIF